MMIETPVLGGVERRGGPPVVRCICIPIIISRKLLMLVSAHVDAERNSRKSTDAQLHPRWLSLLGRSGSLLLAEDLQNEEGTRKSRHQ